MYASQNRETAQFIDQEYIYGYERRVTYMVNWAAAHPDVLYLPGDAPVQLGDLLEVPCDISANHYVCLYMDGSLGDDGNPTHWGRTLGFVDRGVYYSWPVVHIDIVGGYRACTLMLPIPPNVGQRLVNQVNVAVAQQNLPGGVPASQLSPTVFISGKRPPFIPMVHPWVHVVAATANNVVTLTLPYTPIRVGDALWVKVPGDTADNNFGPFPVLTVVHNPDRPLRTSEPHRHSERHQLARHIRRSCTPSHRREPEPSLVAHHGR